MLKINLLCVGNLKERFWTDAANEYMKRLQRFCSLNIIEVEEETKFEGEKLLDREGKSLLQKMGNNAYLLAIEGKELSSEEFAGFIEKVSIESSEITFIIGGSYGVSEQVKKACQGKLSFGKATYPHNLARIILLEQLYRAFMINSGARYHK